MSLITEEYIAPNFEKLKVQVNHRNESFPSSGSINLLKEDTTISHLGFDVYDLNFDQSNLEVRLYQIDTISHKNECKGYGSIALQKLIKYAIELKASEIYGTVWIQGDKDQLEAFYKKNFATLTYTDGRPSSFTIDLKNPELLLARIETAFYKKRVEFLEKEKDFFQEQYFEYDKIVSDYESKESNANWLVKLAKKIVGEEK